MEGEEDTYTQALVRHISTLDLNKQPKYVQLGVGGLTGWLTGMAAIKVGKVLACAVGGSFLLVNVIGTRAG